MMSLREIGVFASGVERRILNRRDCVHYQRGCVRFSLTTRQTATPGDTPEQAFLGPTGARSAVKGFQGAEKGCQGYRICPFCRCVVYVKYNSPKGYPQSPGLSRGSNFFFT